MGRAAAVSRIAARSAEACEAAWRAGMGSVGLCFG